MADYPADAEISGSVTNAAIKASWQEWLARDKQSLGGTVLASVQISAFRITPVSGIHAPYPSSGSSDDLKYILLTGTLEDGAMLLLTGTAGNTITVWDGVSGNGGLLLDGDDMVLSTPDDHLLLRRDGTKWQEVFRSDDKQTHGKQILISSSNFTVPRNVTTIWATVWGGGGGGGGASDGASVGTDGVDGIDSTFSTITAAGGAGGIGAIAGRGGQGGFLVGADSGHAGSDAAQLGGKPGRAMSGIGGTFSRGDGGLGGGISGLSGRGGGGGSSGQKVMAQLTVTPGDVIGFVMGTGGAGGAMGGTSDAGDAAFSGGMIVEW